MYNAFVIAEVGIVCMCLGVGVGVNDAYSATSNICAKSTCFVNVKQWVAVWVVVVVGSSGSRGSSFSNG